MVMEFHFLVRKKNLEMVSWMDDGSTDDLSVQTIWRSSASMTLLNPPVVLPHGAEDDSTSGAEPVFFAVTSLGQKFPISMGCRVPKT